LRTWEVKDIGNTEPSIFSKTFTVVGFGIVISVLSLIATAFIISMGDCPRYFLSVFGISFGLLARYFQWTVFNGIRSQLPPEGVNASNSRLLAELSWTAAFFRTLITVELIASVALLVFDIITR
jgi:hypothetical protein